MPFSARALEEKRARLGLVECVNHELLQPYPVLHQKPVKRKMVLNLLIYMDQLLLHHELYQDHVSPPANADADLTYLENIKITSRDGEWGDEYTLQVAADFFQVIIVVLTSDEQVAVNDYFPHVVDDHKQGILDGVSRAKAIYGYLNIMVIGHSMGGPWLFFADWILREGKP